MTEPDPDDGSLTKTAAMAAAGLLGTLLVCFAAVTAWNASRPDKFVVDFYPQTPDRLAQVVFRWPSRGLQMEPVEMDVSRLPGEFSKLWGGSRPKRSDLTARTILPAGRVIESDTRTPPGRFVVALGRKRIEVSPESDWRSGG